MSGPIKDPFKIVLTDKLIVRFVEGYARSRLPSVILQLVAQAFETAAGHTKRPQSDGDLFHLAAKRVRALATELRTHEDTLYPRN